MRLLNEVRILSMTGLMNSRGDSRLFLLYWGMNVQQRGGMASSGAEIAAFRKRLISISVMIPRIPDIEPLTVPETANGIPRLINGLERFVLRQNSSSIQLRHS